MSDIRPGPVARRLECYKLALTVMIEDKNRPLPDWDTRLDDWAEFWHGRIYGGPLPAVEDQAMATSEKTA